MKKRNSGQSLFELVVAIAVSALIIVAIVSLVTNAIKGANFSKNNALASSSAQETIEWLRTQRDTNIQQFLNYIDPGAGGSSDYCFSDLSWNEPTVCQSSDLINNLFQRSGHFDIDKSTGKTIIHTTITVSWYDGTTLHEVINSTDFSDPREI